jgi:hypothetical protein
MITNEYAFIIPTFNPNKNFIELIKNLSLNCNEKIFIIDDGSTKNKDLFEKIIENKYKNVFLLRHAVNLGKGAALKMVFNHILVNFPNIKGCVTLDSDGQHCIKDCINLMNKLKEEKYDLILGYRKFSKNIPLKSYIGNNISRFIYKLVLGRNFKDTQTGLRAISKEFMKKCLSIKSNRFEFETEQLAIASFNNLKVLEVSIDTIYIENNSNTSFRPLIDSLKIYFILFRYMISSIFTSLVDFIVFSISIYFNFNIISSNIIARTFSIFVQFFLLNRYVFNTSSKLKFFILFVLYVYVMGFVSSLIQLYLLEMFYFSVISTKIFVEIILFFINFAFLKVYIFNKK